jgi:CubicO group peptidase (beta-lactamase class C family)
MKSKSAGSYQKKIFLILLVSICYSFSLLAETPNPHRHEEIGTIEEVYDATLLPDLQVNTYRNIDRLFPTRDIHKSTNVYPLPYRDEKLGNITFTSKGQRFDVYDYISFNRISGLLILKDGEIAFETYQLGNTEQTRWMSMSVVKSILSTLVGAAIKNGHIHSIDDPLTEYLPDLKESAYDGTTVRNLLQMASGVKWNETYSDPSSDRRAMLKAQNSLQPGAVLELMKTLPRAAPPGTHWNYSTGEAHVIGAMLRAAIGQPLADYLSERIWALFGMESDATWWLEAPDGLEVGGSGFSATLRDYGRFGLFLLNGGQADGEQILPDNWIAEASSAKIIGGEPVDYGYLWWPVPESKGPTHKGAYEALGIFHQIMYINPKEDVVIMVWSAMPKPWTDQEPVNRHDFFAAVCQALR